MYLLDYKPVEPNPTHVVSDSLSATDGNFRSESLRSLSEPVQYGFLYGTSAISAFGGPSSVRLPPGEPESTFSRSFGQQATEDYSLTAYAMPVNEVSRWSPKPPVCSADSSSVGPPKPSTWAAHQPTLALHAKMYAAADRYGVVSLKASALDKFKVQLTRHWDSDEFAQCVHVVYSTTPPSDRGMREAVATSLSRHSRMFNKPEMQAAVLEINDWLMSYPKEALPGRRLSTQSTFIGDVAFLRNIS